MLQDRTSLLTSRLLRHMVVVHRFTSHLFNISLLFLSSQKTRCRKNNHFQKNFCPKNPEFSVFFTFRTFSAFASILA
ncbi:hypothetical protein L596_005055 [Steinernema carpocapsae]|uniref:Uncharacterized protein n=1 Tax=Steinernema carpocapsae TaxID=34508 RepID=A0A4U8UZ89_STECR|nr:hypothetical protein L596_005055 [Steinernema carpocapsae]